MSVNHVIPRAEAVSFSGPEQTYRYPEEMFCLSLEKGCKRMCGRKCESQKRPPNSTSFAL
jgi:hypothetical protein